MIRAPGSAHKTVILSPEGAKNPDGLRTDSGPKDLRFFGLRPQNDAVLSGVFDRGRRKFLKSLFCFSAILFIEPFQTVLAQVLGPAEPSVSRRPAQFFSAKKSARVVGRAFLREHPFEGGGSLDRFPRIRKSVDSRKLVADQVRRDFEEGRVVRVQGWLLSRTEARLYGLAALSQ